jgi:hypothetical protein
MDAIERKRLEVEIQLESVKLEFAASVVRAAAQKGDFPTAHSKARLLRVHLRDLLKASGRHPDITTLE